MADVFLSYNREDQPRARQVADALEAEGFTIWWDAALRAGETYDEVTEKNLRHAAAVVVLWSKRSVNSKWVRAEATVGERSSTLVPALLEECDRPVRFELVQTADLTRWRGDRADPNWRAFVQDIRTAVARFAAAKGAAPAAARPASGAAEIETAFWTSVKESRDPSDFEAYLARYPNGYFASLAKNRLSALIRQPSVPSPPSTSSPPPPSHRPVQAPAAPAQRPAPPRAAPQPPAERKSANGLLIGVVAIALAGAAVAAFVILSKPQSPAMAEARIEEPEAVPPATPPQGEDQGADASAERADDALVTEAGDAGPAETADPAPTSLEAATALAAATPPEPAEPPPVEGAPFRDCPVCPQMTPIRGGVFMMGSPDDEPGRNAYEGPQHEVTTPPFSIGVFEVTNAEWRACVEEGACSAKRAGDDDFPVLGVSWREATGYAAWLSKKTGRSYRLPSEAEWEFAARGGTTTAYWWGDRFEREKAGAALASVGASGPNGYGVYDVTGNAREWTADCYVNNFRNAPIDGSPARDGDCSRRVIRGGAWSSAPADMRVANRSRIEMDGRPGYMGFRVAADAPGR